MVGNTVCPNCKSAFGLVYDPSHIMPRHSDRIIHYWCQDCGHTLTYDTIIQKRKPINIMHYLTQPSIGMNTGCEVKEQINSPKGLTGRGDMNNCKGCANYGLRQMLNGAYSYSGDIPCLRCKRLEEKQDLFVEEFFGDSVSKKWNRGEYNEM